MDGAARMGLGCRLVFGVRDLASGRNCASDGCAFILVFGTRRWQQVVAFCELGVWCGLFIHRMEEAQLGHLGGAWVKT
jgi:hypothetical protein